MMGKLPALVAMGVLCGCGLPTEFNFRTVGTVTSAATGSAIAEIRVKWHVIVPAPGDGPDREVGTDAEGKFSFEFQTKNGFLGPGQEVDDIEYDATVDFEDNDGIDNGGEFSAKHLDIKVNASGTPTVADIAL